MKLKLFLIFINFLLNNRSLTSIEAAATTIAPFENIFAAQNVSEMAIGLSEIIKATTDKTITILNAHKEKSTAFNELIMEIHRLQLQTCIFNRTDKFFKFIETNLRGSLEVTALIFHNPQELIQEVRSRFFFLSKLSLNAPQQKKISAILNFSLNCCEIQFIFITHTDS
jgi:hypothetical protein